MLRDDLLTIDCELAGGIGLMRMEGELLAESRYEPERILREWLESDVSQVIVDLSLVTHIDSAGISTLLGALHRYRRHDGDLILAELNPGVAELFEVTSMQHYFKIFDDVAAARKHFKPIPAKPAGKKLGVKKSAVKKTGAKKAVAKKTAAKKTSVKKKPTQR